MSGSYFMRHTEGILVKKEDLQRLWEQDRIAIHFPGQTSRSEYDSESLSPTDYGPPNEKGVAAQAKAPQEHRKCGASAPQHRPFTNGAGYSLEKFPDGKPISFQ